MTDPYIVSIDNRAEWQKTSEPDLGEALKVLKYRPVKLYKYFVDTIVRTEMIWLCGIGENWVMLDDERNIPVLCPLWPARVFAMMWMPPMPAMPDLEVRALPLNHVLAEFLPALEVQNIGICFDQANNGPIVPVEKVVADLQKCLDLKRMRLQ